MSGVNYSSEYRSGITYMWQARRTQSDFDSKREEKPDKIFKEKRISLSEIPSENCQKQQVDKIVKSIQYFNEKLETDLNHLKLLEEVASISLRLQTCKIALEKQGDATVQLNQAIDRLTIAIERDPNNPKLRIELGDVYFKLERYDDAYFEYIKSMNVENDFIKRALIFNDKVFDCLLLTNHYDLAVEFCKENLGQLLPPSLALSIIIKLVEVCTRTSRFEEGYNALCAGSQLLLLIQNNPAFTSLQSRLLENGLALQKAYESQPEAENQ